MEYTSPVWFLPATSDLNCLDAVQNRAACWACGSIYVARWHRDKKQWSKSSNVCLTHLHWPLLHDQRKSFAICKLHSIIWTVTNTIS